MIAKITFDGQTISVPCTQVRPYTHIWNVLEIIYPDIDALLSHFNRVGDSVLIKNSEDNNN